MLTPARLQHRKILRYDDWLLCSLSAHVLPAGVGVGSGAPVAVVGLVFGELPEHGIGGPLFGRVDRHGQVDLATERFQHLALLAQLLHPLHLAATGSASALHCSEHAM